MVKNEVRQVRGGPHFVQGDASGKNRLRAFVPEIAVTERQGADGQFVREVYPAAIIELRENGLARNVARNPDRTAIRIAATAAIYIWMICHAVRVIGLRRGR